MTFPRPPLPLDRHYVPHLRAPETMTVAEQAVLLRATAEATRDHTLYSMAIGTGLRLTELLGLNIGDVSADGCVVRRRVTLDTAMSKGGRKGGAVRAEIGHRAAAARHKRHSTVTAVYRATGNLFLAQRLAQHAAPITTIIYTHPSDEELAGRVRDLRC